MTLEKLKSDPRWNDKNFRLCWLLVYSKIVPRYLYKFCQIDEHLIDNLKNNQLWFSSSKDFNDPFDCKINLVNNMTPEEIEKLANKFVEMRIVNKNDRFKIVEILKSEPEKTRNMANIRINDQLSKLGICCFSKEKYHIPMWSHYADKHQGVCLKFDVLADTDIFFAGGSKPIGRISNMEYSNKYPQLNAYNALVEKGITRKLPFSKSNDWIYEKEFRIISDELEGIPLGIPFNKEALIEVNFGCRIDELENSKNTPITKVDLIETIKEANYPNIKYYKAITSENRFELNFEEIHI